MRTLRRRRIGLGALVLVAVAVGVVKVNRGATGPIVRVVTLPGDAQAVTVDAQTQRVFVVSDPTPRDGTRPGRVSVLDTRTGALLRVVTVGRGASFATVDQRTARVFVLNTASGTVSVLDGRTGRVLHATRVPLGPRFAAVDEHTRRVFVSSLSETQGKAVTLHPTMQLLDAASGRLLRSISVDAYPSMIVVDASTNHGFVVSNNGATQMVDATSGQVLRTIPVNGIGCSIGAGVDERANHLFIPRLTGVSVIDTRSGSVLRTIPMRQASGLRYGCAGSLLASPTGVDERTRRVFVGGFMGFASDGLSMLDARDGRLLRTVKPGSPALAVAVDERAGRVFVARDGARELDVLDAATGTVVRRIHVGALCKAVAVDERTGHAFVIAGRGTVPLSDIWSWLPSWMRRWMPFLPRSRARPVPSRVTTLDVER